ncbi:ABC transporter permease [Pseudidiomarina insulisalsae]|uniref:ABC transporter permease n=1 Tax=Pseudidiomarina insulisalsae TaxID=575789 RepID=A0A432YAA5_9GAMM|nr:ABC transporter permease [Pseudidiomarina insulisalsae]RUO57852.1 ABC transporter permease [Pseudidiomarina insulisalsae]
MIRYSLRRLTLLLVTLWLLTVFLFALNYFFPGDALTNMTGVRSADALHYQRLVAERNFDGSIFAQYLAFLSHFMTGDWGQSLTTQRDVFNELLPLFGATLELSLLAMILALVIGAPLGLYAAGQQRGTMDRVIMGVSLSAYSIPVFWLAQLFILFFAVKLGWTPISGQINPLFDIEVRSGAIIADILLSDSSYKSAALADAINHLWLPVIVLAIMPATMLMRITRNSMLDVLQQNFIRAARARGLSEARILLRHALPNAMQPVVRQLGLMFSVLMSNIIVTEVIFNWPGIGGWLVKSIYERDYPVMQGGLFAIAAIILLVNVAVELFHAWRYPQVRKELYAEH